MCLCVCVCVCGVGMSHFKVEIETTTTLQAVIELRENIDIYVILLELCNSLSKACVKVNVSAFISHVCAHV